MNVFEDLVKELKDEHLLEETVIDSGPKDQQDAVEKSESADLIDEAMAAEFELAADEEEPFTGEESETGDPENRDSEPKAFDKPESHASESESEIPVSLSNEEYIELENEEAAEKNPGPEFELELFDFPRGNESKGMEAQAGEGEEPAELISDERPSVSPDEHTEEGQSRTAETDEAEESLVVSNKEDVGISTAESDDPDEESDGEDSEEHVETVEKSAEAIEVASFQFVEHQLTTIIRNQLRKETKPYDVVTVNQALHQFERATEEGDTESICEAETALRSELENWKEELLARDSDISTSLLRKYSEELDLSEQALLHLGRFYRNAPFSEATRCKFDFVITRLFTRDSKQHMREMSLDRDELIAALEGYYDDWSSVHTYADDEDDSGIVLAAFKFEDFISEAKSHKSFDELIASGFLKRIRSFKKRTGENFFAPLLVASAIECNVSIGNRYVALLKSEAKKGGAQRLRDKYGAQYDDSVSEAASKTLTFVELLNKKKDQITGKKPSKKRSRKSKWAQKQEEQKRLLKVGKFRISKGDAVKLVLIVIGFLFSGFFVYAGFFGSAVELTENQKKIREERSFLHTYVKRSSVREDTFGGEVSDNWKYLDDDKKLEILSKIYSNGKIKGFTKVELKNDSGRVIAIADGSKLEVKE